MNVLITVPNLTLSGGVANIYRSLTWNKSDNISYFFVSSERSKKSFFFTLRMFWKFIAKMKSVELVHVNPSLDVKSVLRDGVLIFLSKLFRKKVVVFLHGWDEGFERSILNNKVYKVSFAYIFNKPDAFLLLGEIFLKKLKKLSVNPAKIFYIPTMADDSFLSKAGCSKNKTMESFNILFLARFEHKKGMDIVLSAFKILQHASKVANIKLIMAGDGPLLPECKRQVRHNNIENVVFEGYVEGLRKHELLCSADILFFPTCYGEGLPCVIMEAMLYGLAIVTRPVGGISSWVKHNENGWLSESTDPEFFAKGLLELIEKPELLERMKKTNQKVARENFTPEKIEHRLKSIYNGL